MEIIQFLPGKRLFFSFFHNDRSAIKQPENLSGHKHRRRVLFNPEYSSQRLEKSEYVVIPAQGFEAAQGNHNTHNDAEYLYQRAYRAACPALQHIEKWGLNSQVDRDDTLAGISEKPGDDKNGHNCCANADGGYFSDIHS